MKSSRALVIVLAALALSFPALAETTCMPYSAAVNQLARQYGETVVARGLLGKSVDGLARIIEIFANKDGSTFTVIITDENGRACGPAHGEYWGTIEWQAPADPA